MRLRFYHDDEKILRKGRKIDNDNVGDDVDGGDESKLNGVILGQAPSPKALQIAMESASTLAMRINVVILIIIIFVILYCMHGEYLHVAKNDVVSAPVFE